MISVARNANPPPMTAAKYPFGVHCQWMLDAMTANTIKP
jgi:hypothetical protein